MAKFSMKQGGKEVGPANVYAPPHDMTGKAGADLSNNGYGPSPKRADDNEICVSVGPFRNKPYASAKTDGITIRGHGAAVKGIKSRGPMG
jgi:hypothetical protein